MSNSSIGLIGLGTMGAMLSLNIAEKGFPISVYNRTNSRTDLFMDGAGKLSERITPTKTLEAFVASISLPRNIIIMVPAGAAVDEQISALKPLLEGDDLIIDASNANFNDTNRRAQIAEAEGYGFLGIGVSGGETGARFGPAIMGGGKQKYWSKVSYLFDAISAKFENQPCATWMGEAGAGHFVKTVHNGIEYADMQLIAEAYGIMRDGLGMSANKCAGVFKRWNQGVLNSYLIEIAGEVASAEDPETGAAILDIILDKAGQKGTGRWTVIESQHAGAPVPVIEAAVSARNLSADLETRSEGQRLFGAAPERLSEVQITLGELESALIAGKVMCYAQGFALLEKVGSSFNWNLPLPSIAENWRAGCIIRSGLLDDMAKALRMSPKTNLMFAPSFFDLIKANQQDLRKVASISLTHGLPVPAFCAALNYFDSMRTERSTANMIQAQRDYFGAHSFERVDSPGFHHGPWSRQAHDS